MTLCNACGAHIDDWKHRTAFLCPRCYRKCPPKVMAVYEDAIAAFERFRKEEYRRPLVGMLPRLGQPAFEGGVMIPEDDHRPFPSWFPFIFGVLLGATLGALII